MAGTTKKTAEDKKWEERSIKFWSIFSFSTKEGKPKSGFLIYTFCLSLVFTAMYFGLFHLITEWLTPYMLHWPVILTNLTQSLLVSAVGLAAACILHRVFSDKRMMLGTYLWLTLYVAVSLIIMLISLAGSEALWDFLLAALWFVGMPLLMALPVLIWLCRRDYQGQSRKNEEEKPWKKYINT